MTDIVIHVDRLVLKGFPREDRHAIAAGLQQELSRVFADGAGVSRLTGMKDLSRMQARAVQIEKGAKPQSVGASVARGIGKEIGK